MSVKNIDSKMVLAAVRNAKKRLSGYTKEQKADLLKRALKNCNRNPNYEDQTNN